MRKWQGIIQRKLNPLTAKLNWLAKSPGDEFRQHIAAVTKPNRLENIAGSSVPCVSPNASLPRVRFPQLLKRIHRRMPVLGRDEGRRLLPRQRRRLLGRGQRVEEQVMEEREREERVEGVGDELLPGER